jgi:hypothetical protein
MKTQTINIPLPASEENSHVLTQSRIQACLEQNTDMCADAASIWARLHYGHAACVDGTLSVQSVDLVSEGAGRATLAFEWTFQDGCSDIFREGTGYVEFAFRVSEDNLTLTWNWPEQPSTADEL